MILKTLLQILAHVPEETETIAFAKGSHKFPSNFKELRKYIKSAEDSSPMKITNQKLLHRHCMRM